MRKFKINRYANNTMIFCLKCAVSSKISGLFYRLVGGEGALIDVARGGLDGDDMRARGERRDVKGVVCPVNLGGQLDDVGHWRRNLHVIVTHNPTTVNDNVLGLNIIIIIGQRHVKTKWIAIASSTLVLKFDGLLMIISKKLNGHQKNK